MTRRSFTVFHFLFFLGLCTTSGATVRSRVDHWDDVAPPITYPYFALVKSFFSQGQSASCGGSLIAPDVVMTAAKCVAELRSTRNAIARGPPVSVEVWVNSTSTDYSEYDYFRKAIRWVIHPGYNEFGSTNDIALLFLDTPVEGVPPVLLNRDDSLPDDSSRMTIIGYGYPRTNHGYEDDYGGFSQDTLPTHACWKAFGAHNFKESLLCASDHGLGGGVAGGPLLIASATAKEDVQVSIISGGARRGSEMDYWALDDRGYRTGANSPKGYTRVSHFVDWIDAQICQYSTSKPSNCQTETLNSVG